MSFRLFKSDIIRIPGIAHLVSTVIVLTRQLLALYLNRRYTRAGMTTTRHGIKSDNMIIAAMFERDIHFSGIVTHCKVLDGSLADCFDVYLGHRYRIYLFC